MDLSFYPLTLEALDLAGAEALAFFVAAMFCFFFATASGRLPVERPDRRPQHRGNA